MFCCIIYSLCHEPLLYLYGILIGMTYLYVCGYDLCVLCWVYLCMIWGSIYACVGFMYILCA
jgi:hypothetical protein